MLLLVSLSFLHAKQLLMKVFFDSLQLYASQLWGLMPANYNPSRFVNQCPPVNIRSGISMHRHLDSHPDKTRHVALEMRSCPVFKEQDKIAELRPSIQQVDRRKLTASVLIVLIFLVTLCSKLWATFNAFVPARNFVCLSLKMYSTW